MDPYEAREASGLTHQSVSSVPNTLASPRVAFGMAMRGCFDISRGVLFTKMRDRQQRFIDSEIVRWSKVAKLAGMTTDVPRAIGEVEARSQPDCIGRPARVGAGFEHAGLVIGNDRANGASQPCPVWPPFDLVAKAAECLSC